MLGAQRKGRMELFHAAFFRVWTPSIVYLPLRTIGISLSTSCSEPS